MFNIFTKKTRSIENFSFIGTDVHCHVLPGVDDGPNNMDTALDMLRLYEQMGYEKIIITPHINESHFTNATEEVQTVFEEVKEAKNKHGIALTLELSAEYKMDAVLEERLQNNDLLTMGDRHLLVELPFLQAPLNWEDRLFELQRMGYIPVLAHAERYAYLHKDLDQLIRIKDRGIELQLNLLSLIGRYGPDVKKAALRLIEKEAYLWIGTDAHHPNDLTMIREQLKSKWPRKLEATQYQRNVEL